MAEEALQPISNEVIKKVREDLNLDEESLKKALESIKEWIELQPHLPKENDDARLERFLIRCKNSMEKTKQALDRYYSLRIISPELMTNWDVNDPWFDIACKNSFYFPMPKLTKDMDRIIIAGHMEDHSGYDLLDNLKIILQTLEIRMSEDYNHKDIYVVEMKYFSLADCHKMSLPLLKKFEVCGMRGYCTRLGGLHFLNIPPYAQFLLNFIKSILKSKLSERIHVYGSDLTEFHKQVSKDLLPTEFGGTAGPVMEYWERWQKKLKSKREWLLSRENIKSDESKRPASNVNSTELFGFEGSFRKLTID